jgi:putative CocE/NonD family hydrolase
MARANAAKATDGPWWEGDPRAPRPRFEAVDRSSVHVTVRDGTRIAIDLFLPRGLGDGETVPAVIIQTPYLRAVEFRSRVFDRLASKIVFLGNADTANEIATYGYAVVLMDIRGAGASFGVKGAHLADDAVADGSDVVDWIAAQPWSSGAVGSTGVSAHGLMAQHLVTARNPHLRAIVPRYTAFDAYTSTHPGGATASRFVADVGGLLLAMDTNRLHEMPDKALARLVLRAMVKGLKPVDTDKDRSLLAAAVHEHESNISVEGDFLEIDFRDDPVPSDPSQVLDTRSPFTKKAEIEATGVPIYAHGGWLDAAFARELIGLHNTIRTPGSRLVIGPWGHGGKFQSSPVVEGRQPTAFPHTVEIVRFFDRHLREGEAAGIPDDEPAIHYFTMGEERWKACAEWPPASITRTLHLAAGRTLTEEAPAAAGSDGYAVDFTAGTGVHSRFGKHLSSELHPVRYPDRRERDQKLLCFDSAPLEADVEVTGHPVIVLHASSTADDGLFIAYVEEVTPTGEVRTVTDAWLRGRDRATTNDPLPYWQPQPYRTLRRGDAAPLPRGEVVELAFDLFPTSYLFRAGNRIRLAIAGADADNAVAIAQDQAPTITVHHGPDHPSRLALPTIAR